MSKNRIAFNNFKAFGEKMQPFSKKPITLIYGPNSIGKSSLLQSQLLLSSYVGIFSFSLINEYFAGDKLDIGNFNNYVHKHDDDRKITYEIKLNQKKDILFFFNANKEESKEIIELYENNFFDREITNEQIRKEFDSDHVNKKKKMNSSDDYLEKFIELSNSIKTEDVLQKFEACQYILNIENIKIVLRFAKENKMEMTGVYLDNELYIDNKNKINHKLTNNIIFFESFSINDTLALILNSILKPAQYLGPLRPYPKRKDMLQFSVEENNNNDSYNNIKKDTEYLEALKKNHDKLSKYKLGFLSFLDPRFRRFMHQTGAFNDLLSDNKKQVFNGSATAHQLWLELINNKELQTKLSTWLSDKHKLKSTYKIRVDKTKVNHMDTIRSWDKDILNDKEKDPISRAINLFDDVILRIVSLQPAFSILVFIGCNIF